MYEVLSFENRTNDKHLILEKLFNLDKLLKLFEMFKNVYLPIIFKLKIHSFLQNDK